MFTGAFAFLRFFVALDSSSEFNIVDGSIDRATLFVAFGAGLDLGISNSSSESLTTNTLTERFGRTAASQRGAVFSL